MHFATVGGLTLNYTLEGRNQGVPLVFINSLGSDLRLWDKLTLHFADQFYLIRYDKRGHGLSDCPPGAYTIHDHANDLAALLDHLNIYQAILIGISVGGMTALDYTLHHPERVLALVLCDTAARIGTTELWNERIQAVQKNGIASIAEAIVARWFTADFPQQHPAEFRGYYNLLTRAPVAGYIATCEALRDADLRDDIGAIEARSLVLCGAEDVPTPPERARELAAGLKSARFELIEKAAHLPCIEQPDVMAAKIKAFFQEIGYGG